MWEKLQQPISVPFKDTPLSDVIAYFTDAIDTQILLDLRALEDAAMSNDLPITIELSNLPAEAVLDLLLRRNDLDYRLHSGGSYCQHGRSSRISNESADLPGRRPRWPRLRAAG